MWTLFSSSGGAGGATSAKATMARLATPTTAILVVWFLAALLTVLIPYLQWNKNRMSYYKYYGYAVEYEQEQQEYDDDGNNNNNNNNNGNYVAFDCSWWQWKCKRQARAYYQYQNNNGNGDEIQTPGWYQFLGGQTEEDRRQQEEMGMQQGSSTGALNFVYAWSLIVFFAIVVYGAFVLYKNHNPLALLTVMAVFFNCALMMLVLIPQGVISTENREIEDSYYGWYGQLSVLMVYTNFWYLVFCTFSTMAFVARACWQRHARGRSTQEANDHEASTENEVSKPSVETTDAYQNAGNW